MPPNRNCTTVFGCACLAAAGGFALFGLGPLDPPNGPISPTYKTLSEVEPRIAINTANTPGDADSKFKIAKPDGVAASNGDRRWRRRLCSG